ncbi:MAG TPA: sigma-E factor negative regulatory protein [Burkholderiaceae bacterium]|jgi:sigma-E factor negative regulatory protein RseA
MNTKKIGQERISELVDGELASSYLPVAFATLNSEEGQNTWDIYHQIGDVLRSDDMAISLSPNFAASFSARLEAEPTILAPGIGQDQVGQQGISIASRVSPRIYKRFSMQGIAVAATVAVFAFISAPQLMVAIKGTPQNGQASTAIIASNSSTSTISPTQEGTVLRDPQIDQYLLAHQRFAPSAYSIAQYARPATFATDSDK